MIKNWEASSVFVHQAEVFFCLHYSIIVKDILFSMNWWCLCGLFHIKPHVYKDDSFQYSSLIKIWKYWNIAIKISKQFERKVHALNINFIWAIKKPQLKLHIDLKVYVSRKPCRDCFESVVSKWWHDTGKKKFENVWVSKAYRPSWKTWFMQKTFYWWLLFCQP